MKIRYKFADGTVSEVEMEESVGAVIIESRCKENNLSRKERYHCYSFDALDFEGSAFADNETPESIIECNWIHSVLHVYWTSYLRCRGEDC